MPLGHEHAVALVNGYIGAWNNRNREAYLALFADNATVEDPVGTPVHDGKEAIGAFFDGSLAMADSLEMAVDESSIRVSGSAIAFMFTVVSKIGDMTIELSPIDVFTVGDDGLLTSMKAYWGGSDMRTVVA